LQITVLFAQQNSNRLLSNYFINPIKHLLMVLADERDNDGGSCVMFDSQGKDDYDYNKYD
jgi:hypothetical protein